MTVKVALHYSSNVAFSVIEEDMLDNKIVMNSLGTAEVSELGLKISSGN